MGKGIGKKNRHGHSSNPQLGSNHGIGKRFRKESIQQAPRIYLDPRSGPAAAPDYALIPPAYPNAHAFPSGIALSGNSSWAAVHGEEMVGMDQLSGYIFMCNGKTKADCYKYRVFGLPSARMDVLEKIKPQMKLFLYDFDLKLLHGIYVAASNGKLAIEPTAFGGRFSAQVRFDIFKDCLPLPESVFKHIIRDNYQGSHKFKQELSGNQVTSLISLFRPIAMPLPAERPGFEVPHALATRIRCMHLPPPLPERFHLAEANQSYRPEYPALPPQDPYSRCVVLPRDIEALSTANVPVQKYVTEPSQFSAPLRGHAPLPPSTRTAAYWAAVASEGLKQAYPSTYQGIPSVSTGLGLPVTSAGAASTPPPVPKNLDAELLEQLGGTSNDDHRYPAVASANPLVQEPSANPIVQERSAYPIEREPSANPIVREPSANTVVREPALVPSQFEAPIHGTKEHLQPSSSSTSVHWTTVASEDPNPAYSVPYQWQWQPSTNIGMAAENVSAGSAPPYSTVQGSAAEFVPHVGTSNNYHAHNVHLATTNNPVQARDQASYSTVQGSAGEYVPHVGTSNNYYAHNVHLATTNGPVQALDQATYYPSAPAYWTVVPSQDPNQLYSGYYQVLPPGGSVSGGDPNQLSSSVYQVLPSGSSALGGEHLAGAPVIGAAATSG